LSTIPNRPTVTVLTAQGEFTIRFHPGISLRDILISGGFPMRSACGGHALCGQCLVQVDENTEAPTPGEIKWLSAAQLRAGVRLACQVKPKDNLHVTLEADFSARPWRPFREDEYSPVNIPPSPRPKGTRYGVAVDLGTTHIRISLWNLKTNTRLDGRSNLNPQIAYGADVLTRLMEAARSVELAQEIGELAQRSIRQALNEMVTATAIQLADIGEICLVGNTAMLSLLSGRNHDLLLQPEYWTRRIDCQPRDTGFLRDAWGVSATAEIRFIPSLGGFIGSDLLAGIVATRLTEQPAGALLIDFGTNSEMALWDGHLLRVTSAAGGPAFEGSGISCGMPGEAGAIYRVMATDSSFELGVLGDGTPTGICGSGLVDIVAWLRQYRRLDQVGRFIAATDDEFVLHESEHTIVLKKRDVDTFQRAKAAIGAGVLWLCDQSGIKLSGLHQIYACGAFGRLLDITNAQAIGLLPNIPISQVDLQGNTALAGCETLLLSSIASSKLDALLAITQVHNMAEETTYERLFVENLYLQPMHD
jgi:uncharacterized 2Fe-2S/4Fe-4S cluster protein (DUF4445 family)